MQHRPRQSTAELDDSLVARLYQQYALSLMAYIRRSVPAREEAEDILLEVFLAALEQKELSPLQRAATTRLVAARSVSQKCRISSPFGSSSGCSTGASRRITLR